MVHVILPFNRYQNKEIIVAFLKSLSNKIVVHPIEEEPNKSEWGYDWIKPCVCPVINVVNVDPKWGSNWVEPHINSAQKVDYVYYKLNHFIRNEEIIDNDYYFVYSDDNLFERRMIDEINKCTTDVIFISVKCIYDRTIIVHSPIPNDQKSHSISHCGLYNFVIKGWVLKKIIFPNVYYADGLLMEFLFRNQSLTKTYRTDLFALYDHMKEI